MPVLEIEEGMDIPEPKKSTRFISARIVETFKAWANEKKLAVPASLVEDAFYAGYNAAKSEGRRPTKVLDPFDSFKNDF